MIVYERLWVLIQAPYRKNTKLSPNPVDISSFDNNFLETDMAQGIAFRSRLSRNIYNFTMDVDPD